MTPFSHFGWMGVRPERREAEVRRDCGEARPLREGITQAHDRDQPHQGSSLPAQSKKPPDCAGVSPSMTLSRFVAASSGLAFRCPS